MSKRMQVLFGDEELAEMRTHASDRGLTLSEWVRQTLRDAVRHAPEPDADRKIEVIRAAARHEFPTADIDQMLEEIARGYAAS